MIYLTYLLVYFIQILLSLPNIPSGKRNLVKHELSISYSSKTEVEKKAYKAYTKDIHYLSLVGSLLFTTQTRYPICSWPYSSTW